jgi:hypothetical protein
LEYQQAFLVLLYFMQEEAVEVPTVMVPEVLAAMAAAEMVVKVLTQAIQQVLLAVLIQAAEAAVLHTQPTALTVDMVMLVAQVE